MNDKDCLDDLCERGSPLAYAVLACVIVMTTATVLDTYAAWQHSSQIKAEQMFVDCANGTPIQLDDRVVTCRVSKPIIGRGI